MSKIYIQQIEVEKCTDEFCNFYWTRYKSTAECCYDEDNPREIKTKDGRFPRWCPLHKKVSELKIPTCENCHLRFLKFCEIINKPVIFEPGKKFPKNCPLGAAILTRR